MKQEQKVLQASVAWYKLSDLIARKEKEKALSVYRLLAHSFEDKAYALQLEADILLYLDDDTEAIEKYKQAVFLYKKENRLIDAIAVCEHLLFRESNNLELLAMLLNFYVIKNWKEKFDEKLHRTNFLLEQKKIDPDEVFKVIKTLLSFASQLKDKAWVFNIVRGQTKNMPQVLLEQVLLLLN
jgi:tetratricopeptide (TPR) repeat protein